MSTAGVDALYVPPAALPPPDPATATPRDRLLDAARWVLAHKGLEGLTLRAIARRAGVSHGAPLRHFPTLASLVAALAAEGFARLVGAIEGALDQAEKEAAGAGRRLTATERLAVAGDTYIMVAIADPGLFSVTFRPERCDVSDPDYRAQSERSFDQLVALVTAAQAEGWHPDKPARSLAAVLWANVHGTAELLVHGELTQALTPDEVVTMRRVAHDIFFDHPIPAAAPALPQGEPA